MSSAALAWEARPALRPRRRDERELPVDVSAIVALAGADELEEGMGRVLAMLRPVCGAVRLEWWAPDDDAALRLVAADGDGWGRRRSFPLGTAGAIVAVGRCRDSRLESILAGLTPVLRRRCAEEHLVRAAMQLARRNEALEDFAALVAHELKTPLQAALVGADPSSSLEQALDLVDSLLEAAQNEARERTPASAAVCLDEAVRDLGVAEVEVSAQLTETFPLPAASLRVIFRNLLRNAVAAGARHIHVAAVQASDSWRLMVDDDGAGLAATGSYEAGSGLGLTLCRRIAGRYGGALEVGPCPAGGTRATLLPTGRS
jgi:signal transduction histidine kinase